MAARPMAQLLVRQELIVSELTLELTPEQHAARKELREHAMRATSGEVTLPAADYDRLLAQVPNWVRFCKAELHERGSEHFLFGLHPLGSVVFIRASSNGSTPLVGE